MQLTYVDPPYDRQRAAANAALSKSIHDNVTFAAGRLFAIDAAATALALLLAGARGPKLAELRLTFFHTGGRMTRWGLLSLLGSLLITEGAAGQRITPGQHVRLTLPNDSVQIGVVDSLSQNQVWLRSALRAGAPIGFDQIRLMEQSQGRKPALAKGFGFGALGGAVVGGALWLAFISGDPYEENKGLFAAVLLASGAVGGALTGAGLSLILARDRWEVVPRDQWAVGPDAWQLGLRFKP